MKRPRLWAWPTTPFLVLYISSDPQTTTTQIQFKCKDRPTAYATLYVYYSSYHFQSAMKRPRLWAWPTTPFFRFTSSSAPQTTTTKLCFERKHRQTANATLSASVFFFLFSFQSAMRLPKKSICSTDPLFPSAISLSAPEITTTKL